MTWVRLDDQFGENPKIINLSPGAFRTHVLGLCYCARNLTDGYVPAGMAPMLAATKKRISELETAGLWMRDENGGHWINDYLDYNPTRDHILEQRQKRRAAGQKGAQNRWQAA